MKHILLITGSNGAVIGPLSLDDAKKGQKELIEKIPAGSGNVTISTLTTLEEYMNTLG